MENNKMEIRIKDNASGYIKAIAGQWVEVETAYLFRDQFNTVPCGDSESGYRIHASDVIAVRNDKRIGTGRCNYCGECSKLTTAPTDVSFMICPKCSYLGYMEDLTPRKVSYIDAYPTRTFIVKNRASNYYLEKGEGMGGYGESTGHPNQHFRIIEVRGGSIKGAMSIRFGAEELDPVLDKGGKIKAICTQLLEAFKRELEVERITEERS